MPDPTRIDIKFDPLVQRMAGVAAHGNTPFDVPFMSEIAPGLWQGGCEDGLIMPNFIEHHVTLYPWEAYRVHHELESRLEVRMYDDTSQALDSLVPAIGVWAWAAWKRGPTLISCQAGLNRSSIAAAYVLMLDGATAAEAIDLIREKRSPACLCNRAFERWLRAVESP